MNECPNICIVVMDQGRILLGQKQEGNWSFPGGQLEPDETPQLGVYRMLLEETGLKAHSIKKGPWINAIKEKHPQLTLFLCVDEFIGIPEVKMPDRYQDWDWFEWEAFPTTLFPSVSSLIDQIGIPALKDGAFWAV